MTDRTALPSLRRRLAVSTMLAGRLAGGLAGGLLLAPPAHADFALPSGGRVIGSVATILPTALNRLNVTVGDATSRTAVINWNTFSIGSENAVNFTPGAGVTGTATVVNRVVGLPSLLPGGARGYVPSTINGTLTGANVNVWLLNPAGILIGSGGSIATSGFVGSTLDLCASDLCDAAGDGAAVTGLLNGLAGAGGASALRVRTVTILPSLSGAAGPVAIRNGGTIDTTGAGTAAGGPIVLLSGMIASTGTARAGTAVTFVAADAVTLADPGSPLGVSIDAGTAIGGTLIETGGTIAGRSVMLAAASRDTVMNALLNIGGTISATGVSAGEGAITLSAGVATAGAAAFTDAARDGAVAITGGGTLTAAGALSLTGNRGVSADGALVGNSVTLDAAADLRVGPVTASRGLTAVSRAGAITGGGLSGADVAIDAAGGVDVASARATDALTILSRGAGVRGGTLSGAGISLDAAGTVDVASATATGVLSVLSRSGGIGGGAFSGGSVSLDAAGDIRIAAATATAGDLTMISHAGRIDGGKFSGTGVSLDAAGAVDVASATATGVLSVLSRSGGIGGGAFSGGGVLLDAAGDIRIAAATATAGDLTTISHAGRIDGGTFSGTGISLDAAGTVDVTSATATGTLSVLSRSGGIGGGAFSGGSASLDAAGDVRVGSATAARGDLTVLSRDGDISGTAPSPGAAFDRAILTAADGNLVVTALSADAARGQLRLSIVTARTGETTGAAPVRGNVALTGRIVDVTTADAAGALTLTARDAAPARAAGADDVRLIVDTALAGTIATLSATQGGAAMPVAGSGGISAGTVAAGRDRRFGNAVALAGDARLTAATDVAVDSVSSGTGGVFVTATDGDVTGRTGAGAALAAAIRSDATAGMPAVADAGVAVVAGGSLAGGLWSGTMRAGKGVARLGPVTAGAAVAVDARAIDAGDLATQAGSIGLTAHDGSLALVSAGAGQRAGAGGASFDIDLRAAIDPDAAAGLATGGLAAGDLLATGALIAARDVRVAAAGLATIAGAVSAGRVADDGAYAVAGTRGVVLGSGMAVVQQAAAGVSIVASGAAADIVARERLVLQSNARGLADPAAADPGGRTLSLDASGALRLGPPEIASGLEAVLPGADAATVAAATAATLAALDARAPLLIGGTAGARSDVVVNAGGGTIALGTVQARRLRAPRGDAAGNGLATNDFTAHRIDVTDDLTIRAAAITLDAASAGQLDGVTTGRSIVLETPGIVRGLTLAAPTATRDGYYIGTSLAATGAVTATAAEGRFGTVRAGVAASLASTGGGLRIDDIAAPVVTLDAAGDLRIGTALATAGDLTVLARAGDVSGIPLPDDATPPGDIAGYGRAALGAGDGNVTVTAAATDPARGRLRLGAVTAGTSETAGTILARGNVAITGRVVDVAAAEAAGGLRLIAGDAGPAGAGDGRLIVGSALAGTAATLTAGNGGIVADAVAAGRDRRFGGASGDARLTAAGGIAAGAVFSAAGDVFLTAQDGDIAADMLGAGGSVLAEALATTAGRGTALLGTVSAGGDVTVRARAIDVTAATATRGALSLTATSIPGGPAGITLGTGSAGAGAMLIAARGDIAVAELTAGGDRSAAGGVTLHSAAGDIGAGVITALTGDVALTADDGDVTAGALTAALRAPATADGPAIGDGGVVVRALSPTPGRGIARIGTAVAGGGIVVAARAIEGGDLIATRGALALTSTALPGGPAGITLGNASAGTTATLTAVSGGDVIATSLTAGTDRGVPGSAATLIAAGDVRADAVTSLTGDVMIRAIDGDVTGAAGGTSRATLAAQAGAAPSRVTVEALAATTGKGTARLGTVSAGDDVTVRARAIDATAITAMRGALALTATALADGVSGIVLGDGRAGTTAMLAAAGRGDIAATVAAGANRAVAGGTATLSADRGDIRVGAVSSGTGDVTIRALDGDVTTRDAAPSLVAAATRAAASGGDVAIGDGTVTIEALAGTAGRGQVRLGAVSAGGDVTIRARAIDVTTTTATRGALSITATPLSGGPAGIIVGTGAAGAGATLVADGAGDVQAGALTAGANMAGAPGDARVAAGGSARIGAVSSRSGNVTVDARGIVIGAGGVAGGASADGGGTITLTTGAGIEIAAPLRASRVTVNNRSTGSTGLGGAGVDAEGTIGSLPFALSTAEFGRIDTPDLTIDSTGRNVAIDTLTAAAAAGREAVRIYTDAAMTVSGRVSFAGTSATRTIQLGGGGEAAATAKAASLAISSQGQDGAGPRTGQIDAGAAVLDLRAGRIVAGRDDFIAAVARSGDVAADFIANPESLLYRSGPVGGSGTVYDPGALLVSAGRLVVRYGDYALFQNTARAGTSGGVLVTGPAAADPPLRLIGGGAGGALALFGSVEQGDNPARLATFAPNASTALLGQSFVGTIGEAGALQTDPNNTRINGCLIGATGGGCLVSVVQQPSFTLFDVSRQQILGSGDDLGVTFDPAVGSNNDALFGDAAAGDYQFDAQPCPDGTTAVQCRGDGGTN